MVTAVTPQEGPGAAQGVKVKMQQRPRPHKFQHYLVFDFRITAVFSSSNPRPLLRTSQHRVREKTQ